MDDLNINPFYNYLKQNCPQYYRNIVFNQWVLCVPISSSLEEIEFSQHFIDSHILKKEYSTNRFKSITEPSLEYEMKNDELIPTNKKPKMKIICSDYECIDETNCFPILIIERPIISDFKPSVTLHSIQDRKIKNYKEANHFLGEFFEHKPILDEINEEILNISKQSNTLESIKESVRELVINKWVKLLQSHSLDWQRNGKFQYLLSVSLEIIIVHNLFDVIFPLICYQNNAVDLKITEKCKELSELKVTADQLGAPDDYAIPLPAATVELASIDNYNTPIEKLHCLQATYELILAELKGAILDVASEIEDFRVVEIIHDIIPFIMTVMFKTKPLHLISNIYFIDNFQWTLYPNDQLSFTLNLFKDTIKKLSKLTTNDLGIRSPKIFPELALNELMQVTNEMDERFDRQGKRIYTPLSPVDRHLERVTAMIAASTEDLNLFS